MGAARAQYRVQRGELFPGIDLTGSGDLGSTPKSTLGIPPSSGGSGGHVAVRSFSAGLGFTGYELDLFGRVASETRQAFEHSLSVGETRTAAQISLVSEVASAYLTMLADRQLLAISQETAASTSDSLRLTSVLSKGGATTLLAVRQAETVVDTARAGIALYTRQVALDENALTLLLGQPVPADLPPGRGLDDQRLLADFPAGLPSELVARRPDIRAAEHDLLAANADIGAARAAFFPSITLTSSGGVASNKLSSLFTGGSAMWSFAPQVNIPIFTAGRNQGNLDLARLEKDIRVATYEKAIQTAFREVSDALAGRATYVDQVRAQEALVAASADGLRLSQLRFRAGVDTFLPVLDAQRTLFAARQDLLKLKEAQVGNSITLYKALGGGWTADTVEAAPSR